MNDKIIFWLTSSVVSFGTTKFIQDKYPCDLFAIADIVDKQKSFYKNQQLVNFQKIWYYHDHILAIKKKPDLNYLSSIEEKYKINLWLLAYNERIFYRFNDFHKFSSNEVLSILEQECKLFESVLEKVKPNFVIMGITVFHHDHIFYEMCKAKGIKILTLKPTNFGYRMMISDGMEIDEIAQNYESTNITITELQNYLKGFDPAKQREELKKTFQSSKINYFKAALKFLSSSNNNIKTHYTYFGRTKFKVIIKMLVYTVKTRYREFFMNRNLSHKITDSYPFVYFPLHIEQERVLLVGAPFYTNQVEVITNIVKSLPVGYKLIVKEHPIMALRGWRSTSTYKKIMELPNVELLHPTVNADEILKKCSLVITISGTAGLEAAFYQKPSITFVDTNYSILPSVHKLKSIEELPQAIRTSLKKEVKLSDLSKYVNLINDNSFECDIQALGTAMQNYFHFGGFLVDVDISIEKMNSFLEEYRSTFELIASEIIKKIEQIKNSNLNA